MVSTIERFHCIQDSQLGPVVSSIERFHCIQDSQLGPNGVHYREVPLYINHLHHITTCLLYKNFTCPLSARHDSLENMQDPLPLPREERRIMNSKRQAMTSKQGEES